MTFGPPFPPEEGWGEGAWKGKRRKVKGKSRNQEDLTADNADITDKKLISYLVCVIRGFLDLRVQSQFFLDISQPGRRMATIPSLLFQRA